MTGPQKPLFVPLNSEHYDNFHDGSKTFELRQGPKRWNSKTVVTGRQVIISKGYGKKNRMIGTIGKVFQSYFISELFKNIYNNRRVLWPVILPNDFCYTSALRSAYKIYPSDGYFIAFECLDLKELAADNG